MSCCRRACQERCYANAAQQHAADATAAEQEAVKVHGRNQPNKGRAVEELAKSASTAAQQHAADATAAEQEALVAAAEEAVIATRKTKVVLHLRMTRPIRTKMREMTTVLTTMLTQL